MLMLTVVDLFSRSVVLSFTSVLLLYVVHSQANRALAASSDTDRRSHSTTSVSEHKHSDAHRQALYLRSEWETAGSAADPAAS